ncbi:Uncharacterised protein [uncultured archaeon]|nr:Uncharacterised protein [uncultured archaeon]
MKYPYQDEDSFFKEQKRMIDELETSKEEKERLYSLLDETVKNNEYMKSMQMRDEYLNFTEKLAYLVSEAARIVEINSKTRQSLKIASINAKINAIKINEASRQITELSDRIVESVKGEERRRVLNEITNGMINQYNKD